MNSQNKSRPLIPGGLHVPGYGSDQKDMKTESAKNHRARLGCHKLMTLTMYNGRSLSSENRLQELEEELERINWDILGLCEVKRKGEEKIDLASGHVLYYRGTEDVRTSGVGFLIHKRMEESHRRI